MCARNTHTETCGISDLASGMTSVRSPFFPLLIPFFTAAFLCGSQVTRIHFSAQTLNLEPAVQQSSFYLVFPVAERTLTKIIISSRRLLTAHLHKLTATFSTLRNDDIYHMTLKFKGNIQVIFYTGKNCINSLNHFKCIHGIEVIAELFLKRNQGVNVGSVAVGFVVV